MVHSFGALNRRADTVIICCAVPFKGRMSGTPCILVYQISLSLLLIKSLIHILLNFLLLFVLFTIRDHYTIVDESLAIDSVTDSFREIESDDCLLIFR